MQPYRPDPCATDAIGYVKQPRALEYMAVKAELLERLTGARKSIPAFRTAFNCKSYQCSQSINNQQSRDIDPVHASIVKSQNPETSAGSHYVEATRKQRASVADQHRQHFSPCPRDSNPCKTSCAPDRACRSCRLHPRRRQHDQEAICATERRDCSS